MNQTPETAKLTIIGIVRTICRDKKEDSKEPAIAFLSEIHPLVPWKISEVSDLLDQLVIEGNLVKGRTINQDYYTTKH